MALSKIIQWIDDKSEKISLIHVMVLSCLFALISIVSMQGGVLPPEMNIRLPYYLSDMPLLNKLYDSKILEMDMYQARELSYFLDFIDSKFIEFSTEHGFPHFLSLTHYLFAIAAGCLIWLFCVKELNLGSLLGIGWLALFWTTPSIFNGNITRTGKMGVAFLAVVLFYVLYKIAVISKSGNDFQISKKLWFLYFMAIFPIAYLDQQGLFFALTVLVFLTIWGLFVRNKNIYLMLLIGVSSVLFHLLYRYAIAPQLTLMLNGYRPDFNYQSLPIQSYIHNLTFYLSAGLFLFLETFRFLTGNPPLAAGFGMILFFIFYPVFYLRTSPGLPDHYRKFFILGFVELLIINFLIIVMNSLMTLRHPFLILPDIRRAHYWSPAIVVLAMTLAVLTDIFYKSRVPRGALLTVMCIAVIGNAAALPGHKAIMLQWSNKAEVQLSAGLLHALKKIDSLADVHDPLIENHPVFQFFKSRNNPPDNAATCNRKGIKYAESGQYQQAIESFNEVIRLKPDYADAYYNRALAYLNQGDKTRCCRDAQKACELGNCKILEFCKSNGICY